MNGLLIDFCPDINECKTGNPCEQLCNNTEGSFACSCRPGYQIKNSSQCEGEKQNILREDQFVNVTLMEAKLNV